MVSYCISRSQMFGVWARGVGGVWVQAQGSKDGGMGQVRKVKAQEIFPFSSTHKHIPLKFPLNIAFLTSQLTTKFSVRKPWLTAVPKSIPNTSTINLAHVAIKNIPRKWLADYFGRELTRGFASTASHFPSVQVKQNVDVGLTTITMSSGGFCWY